MPPRVTDPDRKLIAAYSEAALRLRRALDGATSANRRRLLALVDSYLNELDALTGKYVRENLVQHFRDGSTEAIEQLKKIRGFGTIDEEFGLIHREAMQALADDAVESFGNGLTTAKRSAKKAINQATRRQILTETIASDVQGQSPTERVKRILLDQGITALQSGNRRWTLEHYASMLTNTLIADAHNQGAATRYVSNGVQYVEVIERVTAPDITCQTMRGKIVKLGDSRLIPPLHPNCFGGIKPFMGDPTGAIESVDDPRLPAEVRAMLRKNV